MTDTLIARLRGQAYTHSRPDQLNAEAADRIEELQAEFTAERRKYDRLHDVWSEDLVRYSELSSENAKLRAEVEQWKVDFNEMKIDHDELQARLTALEGQEPVAWIIGMTESAPMLTSTKAFAQGARDIDGRDIKPLFLAAGAAPILEHEPENEPAVSLAAQAAPQQAEPVRDFKKLYEELLYCVGNKYQGETRHETAKRYLLDREKFSIGAAKQAEPKEQT